MERLIHIRKNAYYDSVTLMTLSSKLKKLAGVADAVVVMGTDMNKEQLESVGLSDESTTAASAADLIIAIKAESAKVCDDAFSMIDELLSKKSGKKDKGEESYSTINLAKAANPELNMAVISVAGEYAAREAMQALRNDMHVMLFSDNVTEEQELELKTYAHNKNLLVMGPDCGTAVLNGVGLCFANAIKRGEIGLVAASGTGLQEVMVLISNLGEGISQAIGTGGRDLSAKIGGIMMLDGLKLLEEDEETKVIVLVSKPPVKEVAEKILAGVKNCTKPVVVCFISGSPEMLEGTNAIFAANLEDAATQAVLAVQGKTYEKHITTRHEIPKAQVKEKIAALNPEQKYIRGLFCGGTLASEALTEIAKEFSPIYSNVAKKAEQKMKDPKHSEANCIVDLGDDIFTVGKPHPMIEPELRVERLLQEAADPETAVILLDFELGFGSHSDPVGVTADALQSIKENHSSIAVVGYILGTEDDYQGYASQKAILEKCGVIVAQSNLHAVKIAMEIAGRKEA